MLNIFLFATLIHFIFTLFKISIQATIYASIIFLFARMYAFFKPGSEIDRLSTDKFFFWWKTGFGISIFLLFFSCTYWGDHGLGDSARIPIGYSKAIHNGDGDWTYFYPNFSDQKHIENYAIKGSKLCAAQDQERYLVFNLQTSDMVEFENIREYEAYAKQHNLPSSQEFKNFWVHYHAYWGGWRFWLFP